MDDTPKQPAGEADDESRPEHEADEDWVPSENAAGGDPAPPDSPDEPAPPPEPPGTEAESPDEAPQEPEGPDKPAIGAISASMSAADAGKAEPAESVNTARQKAEAKAREKLEQRRDRKRVRDERRETRPKLRKLRFAFVIVGLSLLAFVAWMFGVIMAVAQDLPDLEARAQYDAAKNSVVLSSDGQKLATLTGNEDRILVDSGEISPFVKQAVVAIEDQRFYEHRGIDFLGIARALEQDIVSGGAVQGASTITQQFVKNALAAQDDRTILQKVREAALAYQIERNWSKDKILTNYLNNIYFGEGAYGIEAAARTYFGWNHPGCGDEGDRCAAALQPQEAAMLAGIISSPTAYSPRNFPDAAFDRRNLVLEKMREQGTLELSDSDFDQLEAISVPEPKQIQPPTADSAAPYFTDWLRQQIVDKYGAGEAFGGGLQIHSTLDLDLQNAAEAAVDDYLAGLGPTAAVVVIDNETGGILAMVGGQDFEKSPFNLATNGRRQPGSSFKPFTLVTALEQGHSPDEVFESAPQEIPFERTIRENGEKKKVQEIFEVSNYEDNYLGSASITTATTYSDNSVYAQLGMDVGPDKVAETAERMGIQSDVPSNPAMILGGLKHGVTPLEMAYAYTTIANGGIRVSGTMASRGPGKGPVAIDKVTDDDGDLVADNLGENGENEREGDEEIAPGVAAQAQDILSTVVSSGTGQRAQVGDDPVWGKTGTTDNNADAWFVGSNGPVTAAVWVGYPDGATPMETEFGGLPVDGGTIPALIWNEVITACDSLSEACGVKDESDSTETTTTTTAPPATTTPPVETTTEEVAPAPVPEEPAPEEAAPAPAEPTDTGADDAAAGGTAAGGTSP